MKDNSDKIKYFIYARKSTESEDRQVLSIPSQIDSLKEVANKFSLKIVKIFTESKSAKDTGREVFNEMLDRIKSGEAQGILCWKLDRLSRNAEDSGKTSHLLQNGIIKHIRTPERDYYPEDNVMLMNVEFGMANQFILDLKTNTRRGLMAKVNQGWNPCVVKPGYMGDKLGLKGEKKVLTDPERFPLIRKAFELMLTGLHPVSEILNKLNNEWGYRTPVKRRMGGKPMSESSIYRIFNDPFYYGKFEYPVGSGNWYDGKHEKMIIEEEYWRVQELLGRKGKARPQKHVFAFTGMIRCGECGSMITAEEKFKTNKGNGHVHHYTYYRCIKRKLPTCSQKTVEVRDLELQIVNQLIKIKIPETFKDIALEYLDKMNDQETEDRQKIYDNQQRTCESLERQLDNLLNMKIKDQIDDEQYKQKKTELTGQLNKIREAMRGTEHRADNWRELVKKTFDFACNATYAFEHGDLETKKAILTTIGSNLTLKDKKLTIELNKPFSIVENGLSQILRYSRWLEPVNYPLGGASIGVLAPNKAQRGGQRESNP
ncbi:MAG: recombinase family protein [Patescibacteria group bacterium]